MLSVNHALAPQIDHSTAHLRPRRNKRRARMLVELGEPYPWFAERLAAFRTAQADFWKNYFFFVTKTTDGPPTSNPGSCARIESRRSIEAVVLALLALKHLPLQFRRERQRASADRASKGYVCDDLLLSPIGSGE